MAFNVLLVDDSEHECRFFQSALSELPVSTSFKSVDGEKLMKYLFDDNIEFPDILFMDLNMPVKNGFECLDELKFHKDLQHIPVIMYSSSFDRMVADELYKNGAHYYIQKTELLELKKILNSVLTMLKDKTFVRPPRSQFVLGKMG